MTLSFALYIISWIVWSATIIMAVIGIRRLRRQLAEAREEAEDYRMAIAARDAIDRIAAAPGYGPAGSFGAEIRLIALDHALESGMPRFRRMALAAGKL